MRDGGNSVISKRLMMTAKMVERYSEEINSLADIGTDHGLLPIYLCRAGIVEKCIACDLREGPLSRAKANIERFGLSERIECRLSDGLAMLNSGEVSAFTITGMGGILIREILKAGISEYNNIRSGDVFFLSPQSDYDLLRYFLYQQGFEIMAEDMTKESNKFYLCIVCRYTGVTHTESELKKLQEDNPAFFEYGELLTTEKNPVFIELLGVELDKCRNILEGMKDNEGQSLNPDLKNKMDFFERKIGIIENILDNI